MPGFADVENPVQTPGKDFAIVCSAVRSGLIVGDEHAAVEAVADCRGQNQIWSDQERIQFQ